MYEKEQVPEDEARSFAKNIGAIFRLTSAYTASGVEDLFRAIGSKYLDPNFVDSEKKPIAEKNKETKKCIIMIVTIIFIILAFVFLQKSINSITVIEEVRTSFGSRYDIWFGSIEMFLLKPLLGWGALGTLEHGIEFMYNNGNVIHSHNVWLTFLVSGGILAFSIYLFIKLKIFSDLLRIYKKYDNYVCLLTALNVMVIIQGLVDCSLYAPQLGVLFIAANSILYNISNGRVKESNNGKEKEVENYKKNMIAN